MAMQQTLTSFCSNKTKRTIYYLVLVNVLLNCLHFYITVNKIHNKQNKYKTQISVHITKPKCHINHSSFKMTNHCFRVNVTFITHGIGL